ncbi:SPOR domain-containing protein [Paenibacillus sp. MMS20-IR301]|uniref:SPOR domain-containing protein n=1 Tax=Paenibacillus sp. MMS20-IR301 TaxID=2895946 RepID=UPI0028ED0162|nr:SPOR domain-containing protein [Paenibacillus sp. MMS20-IR301]WNS43585.1 hypothetical protein LOS79_32410 [Paenibacillus sp. MMS20-IR301]
MTFRFDRETDTRISDPAVRRSTSVPGTAPETERRGQAENSGPALQPRADRYILDMERVELPGAAEVSYMKPPGPRRRNWDEPDERGGYDNGYDEEMEPGYVQYSQPVNHAGRYGGSYRTRRPSYWWKLALSVAGALGTGVLLGFAALSFIGSGGTDTGSRVVQPAAEQSPGAVDEAVSGITGLSITGSGGEAAAQVPVMVAAQSYYLLQYGVFSTPAGAAQAQQELLAAGLAAGLDPADGNRVYAGISPDREQAKLLSSGLKNQGIELYVREVPLPPVSEVNYGGTADAVNEYFAVSGKLLSELSALSASLLSGTGSAADNQAVSDLHMQWTQAVKQLEPGLSAEGQGISLGLEKSMSRGIAALNEYGKNRAEGLLWEVQEAMMSFLTGQKSLLAGMS